MYINNDIERVAFLGLCDLRGVGFETLKKAAIDRIPFRSFFNYEEGRNTAQKEAIRVKYARIFEHLSTNQKKETVLHSGQKKLESLHLMGIRVLFPGDGVYPERLMDLQDYPRWLFVQGNALVLKHSAVTAVGSRKVSCEGSWLAAYFGYSIQEIGAVTVSGLAEGVDQIIHRASLVANLPTVAVLGTGILSNYPKGSEYLRKKIIEANGCIVTEYLPNDTFSARNFVRRNRIQAALGHVVFPVEWTLKSGTAHTVKFAKDLCRPMLYVRTPTQPKLDWIPSNLLSNSMRLTLPRDHDKFISYLKDSLNPRLVQTRLF
ncbi:DNA-processing protein DprA [Acetobacter syzygii]|uniref:DNA-processing protein DprA n=1 Tax=Acetobacter syzygii TaxID=146476 RepID=UPI0039EA2702